MSCTFEVSPYDGGWCVKITDTGEVLFFPARRRALAEARLLARRWPSPANVRVQGRAVSERSFESWTAADAEPAAETVTPFAYPLGAPA